MRWASRRKFRKNEFLLRREGQARSKRGSTSRASVVCNPERREGSLIIYELPQGDNQRCLKAWPHALRISLQRFAQFATGRIRRGGHDIRTTRAYFLARVTGYRVC